MIALDTLVTLVEAHPFLVLLPLAILEGPIVTVAAAWLMRGSVLDLSLVYLICVAGDLIGDVGMFALGRRANALPARWQRRLGITEGRLDRLAEHFRYRAGRTLVLGKLTHSAGFAVLLAAGASGMDVRRFLGWSLLATLPKTLAFVLVGYGFGMALGSVDTWLFRGSLLMLAVIVVAGGLWGLHHHQQRREAPQ